MVNQKVIFSIVEELKHKRNIEELIGNLRLKEFWLKVLPANEKHVEIKGPNVIWTSISEDFLGNAIGGGKSKMEINGELVIEDRGSDEKGRFLDFHVRDSNIAQEAEGRIRIRPASGRIKVGIFMYALKMKTDLFGLGQQAAEMILRKKVREMLHNIDNF